MAEITFISFAGTIGEPDPALYKRQTLLHETAQRYGAVDHSIMWRREDLLETDLYREHKAVFDQPRGCGYWAWKPWSILKTMENMASDDYVVYHDVGKPFRKGDVARGGNVNSGNVIERPLQSIVDWAERHSGIFPGVNTPHYGPASMWTKRDCFVGMGCDAKEYWDKPLVQAGYNAWKNTPRVREFLSEWLKYCVDPVIVSDQPNRLGKDNFADYREHRHDQSVLSNLLRRWEIEAYGSITESRAYVRNFNYLVRRTALDQNDTTGALTVTDAVRENGGSRNLPISASTWIDLDLATLKPESVRVLWIRSRHNREEAILERVFNADNVDIVDWTGVEENTATLPTPVRTPVLNREEPYDFVFAFGINDQVVLRKIVKTYMTRLKPFGQFYAGLDHGQIGANDQTFAGFIDKMSQTRRLDGCQSLPTENFSLVIGTASNPIPMKQRDGQPIVAVIQRGLDLDSVDIPDSE